MSNKQIFEELNQNPRAYRLAIVAVLLSWAVAIVAIVGLISLYLETSSQAFVPPVIEPIPELMIEPAAGPVGSAITVQGRNWPVGANVMVYLTAPDDTTIPVFAVAGVSVDPEGQFVTTFSLLPEAQWQTQKAANIIAQTEDGRHAAEGRFTILTFVPEEEEAPATEPPPTVEPTVPVEPSEEPTAAPEASEEPGPAPTPVPSPTVVSSAPQPTQATATSQVNLNVRSGPGTSYAIIGLLRPGDTVEVTGSNADRTWWQIEYLTPTSDRGWVSGWYVSTVNTANVPIVSVPAPPPTPPTPTPTPVPTAMPSPTITEWRGDYFNNRTLSGPSRLVRNDVSLNFNWGYGSPHPSIQKDNFSVRWTRSLPFTEGTYRFHAVIDDGVRLFIDDALVIDSWVDGGAREVVGERWLPWGNHTLRVEHYEHTGYAVIETWWEKISVPGPGRPDADFDANRRSGSVPLEVDFDNESSGDYDDCKWYFGDGDTSTRCRDREHTYDKAGKFTVKLRVRGPGGEDTKKREDYITVRPVARFATSPVSGQPLSVSFTNQSTEHEKSEWQFGDGKTSTLDSPIYTYAAAGTYSVKLRVKENDVWSDYASQNVTVSAPPVNQPPQAVINAPTTGLVDGLLTFDGGSSSDPEGKPLTYVWDFGDGSTASGVKVSHSYSKADSYNVILTVTDSGGLSDTSTFTLLIQIAAANQPPVAVINGPTSAKVGETLIFDSTGSRDPDGTIDSYVWDFGDREVSKLTRSASSGESTMAHVYQTPGTYQVTLTVSDNGGLSNTATHTVFVETPVSNQPPVAVINGPTSAVVDETVIFDSGGSHDPDGTIDSYVWDFGDREVSKLTRSASSGESTMAHVYQTPGTYQVTLTVSDNGGLNDTAGHSIVVGEPAANQSPAAVINGPTQGSAKTVLTFDGGSSSDPDGWIDSYAWEFGDGGTASGVNVDHIYTDAKNHNVSLTVTDNKGLSDTTSYTLPIEGSSTVSAEEEAQRQADEEAQRLAEEEAQRQADEEAQRLAEEEAQRQADEEAQRLAEEEAQRLAEEEAQRLAEEEAQRQADEEAQRLAEEEAQRQAEEEAQRLAEEEAQRQADEEAQRLAEEEAQQQAEEEAQQQADEEAQRLAEEEAQRQAEEEAQRLAEEEAQRQAEEEAQRLAEEEAQRQADEEAQRLAEEEAQRLAEEETQRLAEEEAQRQAEEEAQRLAEEEAQRLAEEEAQRQAEEEAQRLAEEEAQRQAEEEAQRLAEEEAQRQADEEAQRLAEEEAQRQAEEEAQRLAEEEAQRQADEEAQRLAEEEAQRLAEEEAQRQAEEEAQRQAEEAEPPPTEEPVTEPAPGT